jgi:hypothetical protein
MSRCTRRASNRTDRGDGVLEGEADGVGVRDGETVGVGVAEAVRLVGDTIGAVGAGDSGAAVQLSRMADKAIARTARLIWRPYVASSGHSGLLLSTLRAR